MTKKKRRQTVRYIAPYLTHTLLPAVSEEYLTRLMEGKIIEKVHVSVSDGEFVYKFD